MLIFGETGTGKELIARAIHNLSARREHTLVKVNCAGVALIVGFHIRAAALTCGMLLLLLAAMIVVTGFSLSLAALVIAAAAGAIVLAARTSHPWSLDYLLSGDWLPIYKLHG